MIFHIDSAESGKAIPVDEELTSKIESFFSEGLQKCLDTYIDGSTSHAVLVGQGPCHLLSSNHTRLHSLVVVLAASSLHIPSFHDRSQPPYISHQAHLQGKLERSRCQEPASMESLS